MKNIKQIVISAGTAAMMLIFTSSIAAASINQDRTVRDGVKLTEALRGGAVSEQNRHWALTGNFAGAAYCNLMLVAMEEGEVEEAIDYITEMADALGERLEAEELFDIVEQLESGSFDIEQIGTRFVEVLDSLEMEQDEEASWYFGVGAVMGIISVSSYYRDADTMLEALEVASEAVEYAPKTVPSQVLEALSQFEAALGQEMDEGTYDEIGLIASNVMEAISPGHNG